MRTRLTGERPSSTRAGICAMIVALYWQAPLHVATDSAVLVRHLRRMLSEQVDLVRFPWGLVANGD
eukprot:4557948-Alexandrium_andersonii.AAC.1